MTQFDTISDDTKVLVRSNGTQTDPTVEVYYRSDPDFGGWMVICSAHGRIVRGISDNGKAEFEAIRHFEKDPHKEAHGLTPEIGAAGVTAVTATIDLTPSWRFAARIAIEVLKNPTASAEAISAAEEELMRLAGWADKTNARIASER